jgi:hypothetical protein
MGLIDACNISALSLSDRFSVVLTSIIVINAPRSESESYSGKGH